MKRPTEAEIRTLVPAAAFTASAVALGLRALPRYDLGWHVAGGLWMLQSGQLPERDPFGAAGSFWLCYSWLFEFGAALLYRAAGFVGLQLLQMCLILLTVWAVLSAVGIKVLGNPAVYRRRSSTLRLLAALAAALFFCSPGLYLRPQLVSLLFFAIMLRKAEQRRLHPAWGVPLICLWANLHILWILAPVVVVLYRRTPAALLWSLLPGFCTPYGWRLFEGMYQYAFSHRIAYSLITEFERLTPEFGLLFWLYALLSGLLLLSAPRAVQSGHIPLLLLALGCAAAAFLRIKYLPFFGVAAPALLARLALSSAAGANAALEPAVEDSTAHRSETNSRTAGSGGWQAAILYLSAALLLAVLLSTAVLPFYPPPLSARDAELLRLSRRAAAEYCTGDTRVFAHFDDGGWLALGFMLAAERSRTPLRCRSLIDGRTLVMGERRLLDYREIVTGTMNRCAILERWGAELAIVARSDLLHDMLTETPAPSCRTKWRELQGGRFWLLLQSVAPS